MLSPRFVFEDNIRPGDLLLKVYRLLEHDEPHTEEAVLRTLRDIVKANDDEGLMVIYNEVFLGLIRERAEVAPRLIRRSALCNLLRQAVVIACTGLETYLPAVMNAHFEEILQLKGRSFLAIKDKELFGHLSALKFELPDVLRLLSDPDTLFVANKVRLYLETNLSGRRGVHVVGVLFGIDDPWSQIGVRLGRKATELGKLVEDTVSRRNDIVHRADRSKVNLAGDQQAITPAFAMQAVDTIRHVVTCLDDLIHEQMNSLRAAAAPKDVDVESPLESIVSGDSGYETHPKVVDQVPDTVPLEPDISASDKVAPDLQEAELGVETVDREAATDLPLIEQSKPESDGVA
jgi:hypothetical protein